MKCLNITKKEILILVQIEQNRIQIEVIAKIDENSEHSKIIIDKTRRIKIEEQGTKIEILKKKNRNREIIKLKLWVENEPTRNNYYYERIF